MDAAEGNSHLKDSEILMDDIFLHLTTLMVTQIGGKCC